MKGNCDRCTIRGDTEARLLWYERLEDGTELWPKTTQVWDLRTSSPESTFRTQIAFSLSLETDSLVFSLLWQERLTIAYPFFLPTGNLRLFDFRNTWVSEFKLLFCASGFCTVMTKVRNSFVTIFQNYLVIIFQIPKLELESSWLQYQVSCISPGRLASYHKETWFIGELFIWSSLIITSPMQVGLWWERENKACYWLRDERLIEVYIGSSRCKREKNCYRSQPYIGGLLKLFQDDRYIVWS